MNKKKRMPKRPAATAKPRPREKRVYTLEVAILGGPIAKSFARKNPVISRTIEVRGDHTLADLHNAIFYAFDRDDEHLYEFQFGGSRPMDPNATRYGPPEAMDDPSGDGQDGGDAERTTLDSLGPEIGDVFGYWFDFGDDWWHQIEVLAIAEGGLRGGPPKITRSVGDSPPQYMDWDAEG